MKSSLLGCSVVALALACGAARGAEPIPLRAGPLHMVFDADNAFLRYIQFGSHEVLRGINAPIRNQRWGTVKPVVSDLKVQDRGDHFKVSFDVTCQEDDIDFRWRGTITGTKQGEIEFTFKGRAHSTFKRNRIGFCVLHGPGASGQPWVIESVDEQSSRGRFPAFISPHQPAKNLKAIEHEVAPGLRARVAFEGEVFEMEDQRNWTDASFKTYCIPLEIPYPVEVPKGTRISQKVRVSVSGNPPDEAPTESGRVVLTVGDRKVGLPKLGLQVAAGSGALSRTQLDRLKALNLDHLRVDLPLSDPSFTRTLARATEQARALGISLQVGLHPGTKPSYPALIQAWTSTEAPVSLWLVIGGNPRHFVEARRHLVTVKPEVPIGVGRNSNFVDLNRERPTNQDIETVAFAINPQIHAFDNASIMETLPIHGDVVRSTRQFMGNLAIVASPVTLRPQPANPVTRPGQLPPGVDVRQTGPFNAAWTLGSIKYLAEAGTDSATFFETVGWKGVMDLDQVSNRPSDFPSRPGAVFDVYHVLRDIGEFAGGQVQQLEASDTLQAVGLILRKPGKMRILVANLTPHPRKIVLRGLGKSLKVHRLGKTPTNTAATQAHVHPEHPLSLPGYGIARLDRTID